MYLNVKSKRKLLVVDFLCAFAGATFFYFAFEFLLGFLPELVVRVQLAANLIYGIIGLALFLSGTRHLRFYRALMWMNFAYAGVCILTGAWVWADGYSLGCFFLFLEAAIIATLAQIENRAWQN